MLQRKLNGIKNKYYMNKILTIAIPTYNRPDKIFTQVMGILPQLTNEVCLIVLDNHSDIPVIDLFDEEVKLKCEFIRNKQNIGADANIAKCFDLCETPWLIVLGDDDPLETFAVETILNDIKQADKNTIFLNYDEKQQYIAFGLDEFLKHCDKRYWCLFWMSGCVYNIPPLKEFFYQYFYSISTMQPNIILLVNVLAAHPEYCIKVTGKRIHKLAGPETHWNREAFIYASLFVYDVLFKYKDKLESTLFHTIADLLYRHVITMVKKEHNFLHAYRIMMRIAKRRGLYNTIRYDFYWFSHCICNVVKNGR